MKKTMLLIIAAIAFVFPGFAANDDAASTIIEASRKWRTTRFVFKGFYTGMSDADALILLRHYDAGNAASYKLAGGGIEFDDNLLGKRLVVKSEDSKVSEFRFSRTLCDLMFRSTGVPTAEFCQAVVNAYKPVKELQRMDIDVPDWGEYLKKYVPPLTTGPVPKKMVRGYFHSNPEFGFELRIAPPQANNPLAYQTDFFVVRRTFKIDINAFD